MMAGSSRMMIEREAAMATRVGQIVHDLSVMQRERTAAASHDEAQAMILASLAHLQADLSPDAMKQLLVDHVEAVQRRYRGPYQRGSAS